MNVAFSPVREDRYSATIEWEELRALIVEAVLKEVAVRPDRANIGTSLQIKQVEEGSPAYRVNRWTATVEIINPQAVD
jgi:hypothetical protein